MAEPRPVGGPVFLAELGKGKAKKKLKKTKTRVAGKKKYFLDTGGRVAASGWHDAEDIHLPRSRFVGDATELVVYKKWLAAQSGTEGTKKKKAAVSASADGCDEKEADSSSADAVTDVSTGSKPPPPTVTIVHVSDTHAKHYRHDSRIPVGDVLIHSGDFADMSDLTTAGEFPPEIAEFNEWMGEKKRQFKHRIAIAGNHEMCFIGQSVEYIQSHLTNLVYLQDSFTTVYGLKVYGLPWTNCTRMAFGKRRKGLKKVWEAIPSDSDIVVTHTPPLGIFDLAFHSTYHWKDPCALCGDLHQKYGHWGNANLLDELQLRVKPVLHLFGHVHDETGSKRIAETTFINSALDIRCTPNRVRIVFDL